MSSTAKFSSINTHRMLRRIPPVRNVQPDPTRRSSVSLARDVRTFQKRPKLFVCHPREAVTQRFCGGSQIV